MINKIRKTILLTVLLGAVSASAFARTNFTTSIGVKASYGNVRNINYGIHYDLKKNLFDFNIDAESNEKTDRLFFDAFFGANALVNNYLGSKYHAFVISLLPGVGVSFAVPYINTYLSIIPLLRLSLAWTTPGGFDLKLIADIGYEFALIKPYTKNLFYKVGLALSYSFDLEEEDYAHKSVRWRD